MAAAASGHNSSLADNCRPLCSDFNLRAFRSAIFDYRPISLSLPLPLLPVSQPLSPLLSLFALPSCFSSSDLDSDELPRRDQTLLLSPKARSETGEEVRAYEGLVETRLCGAH